MAEEMGRRRDRRGRGNCNSPVKCRGRRRRVLAIEAGRWEAEERYIGEGNPFVLNPHFPLLVYLLISWYPSLQASVSQAQGQSCRSAVCGSMYDASRCSTWLLAPSAVVVPPGKVRIDSTPATVNDSQTQRPLPFPTPPRRANRAVELSWSSTLCVLSTRIDL
jgi:hypothetical protein